MKIIILLVFIAVIQVNAKSHAQIVSLSENNSTIQKVFSSIKKQTGHNFLYDTKIIKDANQVSIHIENVELTDALDLLFEQQPFTYEILNNTIVVKEKQRVSRSSEEVKEKLVEDQQQQIVGIVVDRNGNPIEGASVSLKGTNQGTSTSKDGSFSILASNNSVLVISYIGFVAQEVRVSGVSSIRVVLEEDLQSLSDVVITALGIKREAKSLGYSATTAAPEEVIVNRTSNFMNALQGKIAGVNITSMGSGAAGTSKIRIRGQSSFGGNNSPLIVVNGVPIDNTNFGARGDVAGRGSNRTSDSGDGLSSINPDDIESMTVLKGAAASALYGSRAKDGVIMITTKNRGDGTSLQFNSNFTYDTPLDYTDWQYEYGQGENGVRPLAPNPTSGQWSFGEKFEPGMTQILFDGIEVPYVPQRHQITDYYRSGSNLTNTLTLTSGGETGGFSLSVSDMNSENILPGSDYNRKNVNLGFTQTVATKLTISGNVNYSKEVRKNPPNIAEQDYSPVVLYNMANSMPLSLLKEYATDENGDEYVWSRFTNRTNPYFALKRFDNIDRDRVFGNITVRYAFTDWLYAQGRVGQDFYSRDQDYNLPTGSQRQPAAPPGFVNGEYVQDNRRFREINADFLIGANQAIGYFGIDLTIGGNQMYRKSTNNNVLVNDFYTRGLYTLGNGRQLSPIYNFSERQVNSLYSAAELSYKDYLYINGTVRNDWFSTLSPENRSILYPSVTASFVFSQVFNSVLPEWITFGKIRAAYAEVGSDTDVQPYSNNLFYSINSSQFPNQNGVGQPIANINSSVVPNPNLRPMRVTEKEVGLEMNLFRNRLSFEFTAYDKLSTDQILQAQVSDASAYVSQLINVGKSQNRGLEMLIAGSPVSNANFRWNASFNASYNTTKVLSLGSDVGDNMITVGTGDYTGELRQVVGLPMGQLFGFGYLRDAQGRQVFDSGNGRALRTANQISFGSALPTWVGGISNNLNYRELSFSFLVDFKLGNKMISGTNFNAWREGLHKGTLKGREENKVVGEGVNLDGSINTTASGVQAFYEIVRSQNIAEEFVYDAGLWQLRQMTVGYDFTKYISGVTSFIKGLKLNAIINNVLVLKKWVPNIHPDQFGLPSDNLVGLEATGLPITRSVGFNLNIKF